MAKIAPQKMLRTGDKIIHKATGLLVVINTILTKQGGRTFCSRISQIDKLMVMDQDNNFLKIGVDNMQLKTRRRK